MMRKVKCVAALDAQEIAIDPALVPVVAPDDLRAGVALAHAQRRLASVPAMGSDGAHVVYLPRTRLITVRARGERADRADVDAHPTLFAVQMIFLIGSDDRTDAAILDAQRPNIHAFAADAHAAVAKDAVWTGDSNH